eukprot:CAMPEP_0176104216 /NCGR_PEP_ID=MMETSP0120_2-20121206/52292_1 /TAXON_ID=160619 /ORGANISM="Kryptoperidinium foliaceum, Strain CCMP 1326" /LENGTH=300 /DNA_ID=CAMNT_0017438317 /DNA_START=8 /DNA_END=907 /DNA_ORIENTATION=+
MAKAKAKGTPRWLVGLYIFGMLVTGTLNTLCTKIQFTLTSVGIDGRRELFHKPWFATLNMMAAMGFVGVFDKLARSCPSSKSEQLSKSLLLDAAPPSNGHGAPNGLSYGRKACLVSAPAALDILATALCAVGMLYIPASVWQMLRGSSIIFAAIFSIVFLKRQMYGFNWLGLALCVGGIGLVGVASVSGDTTVGGDPAGMIFGMAVVVAGQVVQAGQIIAEEFLMKNVDLPALQVVGLEGFWGTLIMLCIAYPVLWVLPGQDGGHQEDPFDTFALLANNPTLLGVVLLFFFSCGTFNATG